MNIEITDAMRNEIVKQVTNQLVGEVRKLINPSKVADEIRIGMRAELTSKIAGEFHRKLNTSDLVTKAMADAERRINDRIEKTIQRGVTLRIDLVEREP
jgi:BMFP domain-containing protein YqiC